MRVSPEHFTTDNYRNWLQIALPWTGYFVLLHSANKLATASQIAFYPLSILVIGIFVQARISVLAHEASHHLLFKNRRLNDFAANLFCLFPLFGTISNYRRIHLTHHSHVNHPSLDPDMQRLIDLYDLSYPISKKAFLFGFLLKEFIPFRGTRYLLGLSKQYATIKERVPIHTLIMRASFYLFAIGALTTLNLWKEFILYWIVPYFAIFPPIMVMREIAEHARCPEKNLIKSSRHFQCGFWEQNIFFPLGLFAHTLHHINPLIPHYKLEAAHNQLLKESREYRENLEIINGVISSKNGKSVLEILESTASYPDEPHLPKYLERSQSA